MTTSTVAAVPFSFPLVNGFPNLNATTFQEVFKLAGGTTPNVSPPTSLKAGSVQSLQLMAATEFFEIAYFTELLQNITSGVPGYRREPYVVDTLTAIVNVMFPKSYLNIKGSS